jgi:hypothetical protein
VSEEEGWRKGSGRQEVTVSETNVLVDIKSSLSQDPHDTVGRAQRVGLILLDQVISPIAGTLGTGYNAPTTVRAAAQEGRVSSFGAPQRWIAGRRLLFVF